MHRSRRRGFLESVLFRFLMIRPMRCYRCAGRFYCPPSFVFPAQDGQKYRKALTADFATEPPPDAPPDAPPPPPAEAESPSAKTE